MEAAIEAVMAVTFFSIILLACLTAISLETAYVSLNYLAENNSLIAMSIAYQLALRNLDNPLLWKNCDLKTFLSTLDIPPHLSVNITVICYGVSPQGSLQLLWSKSALRGSFPSFSLLGRAYYVQLLSNGSLVVIECVAG